MKRTILFALSIACVVDISAQQPSVLKLTQAQLESYFMAQNLELIATRLNVDLSEGTKIIIQFV